MWFFRRLTGDYVFCATGKPVLGDVGELVCTKPFPSMPTSFWNDKSGEKYKRAYFSQWPGKKAHNYPFDEGMTSATLVPIVRILFVLKSRHLILR